MEPESEMGDLTNRTHWTGLTNITHFAAGTVPVRRAARMPTEHFHAATVTAHAPLCPVQTQPRPRTFSVTRYVGEKSTVVFVDVLI